MIEIFAKRFYPTLTNVVRVHSDACIFKLKKNQDFFNRRFAPILDSIRHDLAEIYHKDWQKFFHLTLCVSDGAAARMQVLTMNLRKFNPNLLHLWQLKTFWHDYPVKQLW